MSAANATPAPPPVPSVRTTQLRRDKRVTHIEVDEPMIVVLTR